MNKKELETFAKKSGNITHQYIDYLLVFLLTPHLKRGNIAGNIADTHLKLINWNWDTHQFIRQPFEYT